MLGRLRVRPPVRLATTVFFAFGTVFWYAAQLATTWYQAHIVAVGLTLLAVGVALGADPGSRGRRRRRRDGATIGQPSAAAAGPRLRTPSADRASSSPASCSALACTARLTVAVRRAVLPARRAGRRLAAARLVGRARRGDPGRRCCSLYNVVSTGHVFHPAYDYLYQLEAAGYTELGYHPDWAVEDPRYLPQNLAIMFLSHARRSCRTALPDTLGTIDRPLCTAPGADARALRPGLPARPAARHRHEHPADEPGLPAAIPACPTATARSRLVTGASLAIAAGRPFVNLMHFSQGWVQFGYRFSNDFVPFALLLVALGFGGSSIERVERLGDAAGDGPRRRVRSSVNAWGVVWGHPRMVSAAAGAVPLSRPSVGRHRGVRRRAARRMLPGVGFWDTAEFQTVAPLLGTAHPTGYPDLRPARLASRTCC